MLTRVNVLLPERKKLRGSSIRNRLAMRMPDYYHRRDWICLAWTTSIDQFLCRNDRVIVGFRVNANDRNSCKKESCIAAFCFWRLFY